MEANKKEGERGCVGEKRRELEEEGEDLVAWVWVDMHQQ